MSVLPMDMFSTKSGVKGYQCTRNRRWQLSCSVFRALLLVIRTSSVPHNTAYFDWRQISRNVLDLVIIDGGI